MLRIVRMQMTAMKNNNDFRVSRLIAKNSFYGVIISSKKPATSVVLDIVKSKHVDIYYVLCTKDLDEYNRSQDDECKLSESEYKLLKEVFVW